MLEQAITNLAIIAFFTAAAGYFLLQFLKAYSLKKSGLHTAGVIIAKTATSNRYKNKSPHAHNFSMEYEFVAAGQTYRKKLENLRKAEFDTLTEGQGLDIVYAPKNPANNCPAHKLANQNLVMILFFAGCCYIVLKQTLKIII